MLPACIPLFERTSRRDASEPAAARYAGSMRVCLFDIDGTLLSSGGAGKAALDGALLEEFGIDVPIVPGSIAGRTDRPIAPDQFALHGIDHSEENWQRLRRSYLRHLPESLRTSTGRVLPGILELLDHLTAQETVLLGLLTGNMPEGARIKLDHYRLWHYFRLGAYGEAHLHRDDIARDARRQVHVHLREEVPPDQVWVIGDTPHDVACARAIGARCLAVATGMHSVEDLAAHQPDLLLPDCSDPSELLAFLASSSNR